MSNLWASLLDQSRWIVKDGKDVKLLKDCWLNSKVKLGDIMDIIYP